MDISFFEQKFPHILQSLRIAKNKNCMSHSYLIYSDDPQVRESFTWELARMIRCLDGTGENIPCGKCRNCNKPDIKSDPDITVIEPVSKSRRIVIGKNDDDPDTLRWFQARFSMSALNVYSRKIGIIIDADRMMPEAQNAFLKTLEEPPKNTCFILTSERPKSLLPTVISRCQQLLMLVNKFEYNFKNSARLFHLLESLISPESKNISTAMDAIEEFKLMLSDLMLEAEIRITEKKAKELAMLESADNKFKKIFNEKMEAQMSAEYTGLREKFLNAVYAWFAQLYQMASGIEHHMLSSQGIIVPDAVSRNCVSGKRAESYLKITERFISMMYWNVSEDLAIHDFIMNIVFSRG